MSSTSSRGHVFHDLAAGRLQWSHTASRQEPHTFVFVTAINNVDSVARDRVTKCGAGVLGNESEEGLPPQIISVFEDFFSDRL
jgi:hypothetical protein